MRRLTWLVLAGLFFNVLPAESQVRRARPRPPERRSSGSVERERAGGITAEDLRRTDGKSREEVEREKRVERFSDAFSTEPRPGDPALADFNEGTDGVVVTRVELAEERGGYDLVTAGSTVFYSLEEAPNLARALHDRATGETGSAVFLDLRNFSEDRAQAFASTLRTQMKQLAPAVWIHLITHPASEGGLELAFTRGVEVEGGPYRVKEVTDGPYQGWFRSTVRLTVSTTVDQFHRFVLRMFATTRELAQLVASALALRLENPRGDDPQGESLAQMVHDVVEEIRTTRGLGDDELQFQIVDQFGTTQIVRIPVPGATGGAGGW
jgi:hypothetical protein